MRIEPGTIDVLDPKLQPLLALTAADRKWMDEIVGTVDAGWDAEDPSRPKGMSFVGSEDFLRAKFEVSRIDRRGGARGKERARLTTLVIP